MKKPAIDKKAGARLKSLRTQIDRADRDLFRALGKRFESVREIGALKRAHRLPVLQKGRWNEVMRERLAIAKKLGLGENFSRELLTLIHQEAIRVQKRRKS